MRQFQQNGTERHPASFTPFLFLAPAVLGAIPLSPEQAIELVFQALLLAPYPEHARPGGVLMNISPPRIPTLILPPPPLTPLSSKGSQYHRPREYLGSSAEAFPLHLVVA